MNRPEKAPALIDLAHGRVYNKKIQLGGGLFLPGMGSILPGMGLIVPV